LLGGLSNGFRELKFSLKFSEELARKVADFR